MFCKVCNTRLGQSDRHCPNCGQDAPAEAAFARTSPQPSLPKVDLSASQDDFSDDEIELEEVSGSATPPPKKAKAKAAPRKAEKPAARRAEKPAAKPQARKPASKPSPASTGGGQGGASPMFAPDSAGLRSMLAESPESLEPGLKIYRDNNGSQTGSGYSSGVGDIDLLARDEKGDLVVVLVSEKGQGEELIAEVLQRIGWVRKHLGEKKQQVRGIVLCEDPPEGLSYAAAAVAGTVTFKTYRVALTFDDLDV